MSRYGQAFAYAILTVVLAVGLFLQREELRSDAEQTTVTQDLVRQAVAQNARMIEIGALLRENDRLLRRAIRKQRFRDRRGLCAAELRHFVIQETLLTLATQRGFDVTGLRMPLDRRIRKICGALPRYRHLFNQFAAKIGVPPPFGEDDAGADEREPQPDDPPDPDPSPSPRPSPTDDPPPPPPPEFCVDTPVGRICVEDGPPR